MKIKSVQSINLWQSLPCWQAGVVQTIYDIVKAHEGELSVSTPSERVNTKESEGTEFIMRLLIV